MTPAGHTLQILIAEDNEADVFLIRQALEEHGLRYQAEVASDGEQALAFLHRFDAALGMVLDPVVLDLNLRTRHGTEILAEIRGMLELNEVPVIVLTSSDSPSDREQATKLGADLYIRKPMHLAALLQIGEQIASVLKQP